ncbi:MAG: hypothetical protein ACK5V3_15575, partial [Bdellovibrionales bacterium]
MRAKLFLASFSMVSMTLQPLAQAKQQENWSAQALKEFVKSTQDKKGQPLSVGQYWEKAYKSFTPAEQLKLKPTVDVLKNMKLPNSEVISIKGGSGNKSARLLVNLAGKTLTLEYLGSQEKFIRVNGVVLTYQDTLTYESFIAKLGNDPAINADRNAGLDFAMKKPHAVTYEEYKRMTPEQRAMMLIRLREVSEAAENVLQIDRDKQKSKKTVQYFMTQPFLQLAEAQTRAEIQEAVSRPCLVAGYVGSVVTEGGRTYCDPSRAIQKFESESGIKSTCPAGTHGCHPVAFPNSGRICEKPGRSNTNYQQFTQRCGTLSPIKTKEEQASLVRAYIKTKDKKDLAFGLDADGKVNNEEEYKKYILPYMTEHNNLSAAAYSTVCTADNIAAVSKIDKNLQSACDTLRDRKIALELYKAEAAGTAPPVAAAPAPGAAPVTGLNCFTDDFAGERLKGKENGKIGPDGKCIANAVPAPVAAATPEVPCDDRGPGRVMVESGRGEKTCVDRS